MKQITTVIYAHNSEREIIDCIRSVKPLTDRIIVIDIQSNDHTITLIKNIGVTVKQFPFTPYVEPARQFGIRQARSDWVLILDSDERLTNELVDEIKRAVALSTFTHYQIPRRNLFAEKYWLKHGGWWPDYQIRLINKNYFKSWPKDIHSTPIIDGQIGRLRSPLIHLFHRDFSSMVEKTIVFENIESDLLLKAKRPASTPIFFRKFFGELFRRLIKQLGFLDGQIGIIESLYQAFSKTITYLFLYEKNLNRRSL